MPFKVVFLRSVYTHVDLDEREKRRWKEIISRSKRHACGPALAITIIWQGIEVHIYLPPSYVKRTSRRKTGRKTKGTTTSWADRRAHHAPFRLTWASESCRRALESHYFWLRVIWIYFSGQRRDLSRLDVNNQRIQFSDIHQLFVGFFKSFFLFSLPLLLICIFIARTRQPRTLVWFKRLDMVKLFLFFFRILLPSVPITVIKQRAINFWTKKGTRQAKRSFF